MEIIGEIFKLFSASVKFFSFLSFLFVTFTLFFMKLLDLTVLFIQRINEKNIVFQKFSK